MKETRKDSKGRNLRNNESIMPDGRYRFRYTDPSGHRHSVYSWKLVDSDRLPVGKRNCISLRSKEKDIQKRLLNDMGNPAAESITFNEMFEKYMNLKHNLKESTRVFYYYCYDHWIKKIIGNKPINSFCYSDIKAFYNQLVSSSIRPNSIDNIHNIVHPVFTLAVRDGLIHTNPSDGATTEIKKSISKSTKRHALTIAEQQLFMSFLKKTTDSPTGFRL